MDNNIFDLDLSIFEQREEQEVWDIRALKEYAKQKNIKPDELTKEEANMFFRGIYNTKLGKMTYTNPNYINFLNS